MRCKSKVIISVLTLLVVLPVQVSAAALSAPYVDPAQGWAGRTTFQFSVKYTDPQGELPQNLRLLLVHPNKQVQEIQMNVAALDAESVMAGAVVRHRLPQLTRAGTYGYYFSAETSAGEIVIGNERAPFHFTVLNLWLEMGILAAIMLGAWLVIFLLYQFVFIKIVPVGRIPAIAIWTLVAILAIGVFLVWFLLAAPSIWLPVAALVIWLFVLMALIA